MHAMNSLSEALAAITGSVSPVDRSEVVPVRELVGRVLVQPVLAQGSLPGHTQSAMDGYALPSSAERPDDGRYRCVGTSWAGQPFPGTVATGECVRIFTGAVLPGGADAVVVQEEADRDGDWVTFNIEPRTGENIRRAGEDVSSGDQLLAKGNRVRSENLGVLIAAGLGQAEVSAKPRVACFSNGDELRPIGSALKAGELYDSNRFVMQNDVREFGGTVVESACLPDHRDAILAALSAASEQTDLVVTSGGASVGEADHLHSVAETLGDVQFWKLPIKPGKPVLFGRIGGAWLLGLPGNPVSSWVTSRLLLRPLLATLEGRPPRYPRQFNVLLTADVYKRPGRAEFQRGILSSGEDAELQVQSAGPQGSHRLGVLAAANCLIYLSAKSTGAKAGDLVRVIPFSELYGPI